MQISRQKVVTLAYTMTDETGSLVDRTEEGEPMLYLHGVGGLLPGLETALEGRSPGDAFRLTLAPDQAFGERDEDLVQVLSPDQFEDIDDLEVGMELQAEDDDSDDVQVVTVVEIEDDQVTVDGNHPLAGCTLTFDITVLEVRDATQLELEHGHAHVPGGHDHDEEP